MKIAYLSLAATIFFGACAQHKKNPCTALLKQVSELLKLQEDGRIFTAERESIEIMEQKLDELNDEEYDECLAMAKKQRATARLMEMLLSKNDSWGPSIRYDDTNGQTGTKNENHPIAEERPFDPYNGTMNQFSASNKNDPIAGECPFGAFW